MNQLRILTNLASQSLKCRAKILCKTPHHQQTFLQSKKVKNPQIINDAIPLRTRRVINMERCLKRKAPEEIIETQAPKITKPSAPSKVTAPIEQEAKRRKYATRSPRILPNQRRSRKKKPILSTHQLPSSLPEPPIKTINKIKDDPSRKQPNRTDASFLPKSSPRDIAIARAGNHNISDNIVTDYMAIICEQRTK